MLDADVIVFVLLMSESSYLSVDGVHLYQSSGVVTRMYFKSLLALLIAILPYAKGYLVEIRLFVSFLNSIFSFSILGCYLKMFHCQLSQKPGIYDFYVGQKN